MSLPKSNELQQQQQQMGLLQKLDRGFHVAHQTVSVDVNLHNWSLEGWTELTVVPSNAYIRELRLDCRQSRVYGITVNGKKCNYYQQDVLSTMAMSPESTVNQHHHYRNGIKEVLSDHLPGELVITLPRNFKIVPQDPSSASSTNLGGDAANAFVPITVKIDFSLRNASTGVNFVGGYNSNMKPAYWHAYTTHSPIGQSTSSWLPCVDGLWQQCTWQVQISVPRTVGDIKVSSDTTAGMSRRSSKTAATANDAENKNKDAEVHDDETINDNVKKDNNDINGSLEPNDSNESNNDDDVDMTLSEAEREELDRDILVICNNAFSSEVAHPFDSSKKVVSFDMFSPLCAHHIGFAVGAFVQTPVSDLRETEQAEEDIEDDSDNSVPISLYTFPGMVSDALNSCLFLYKAMEFLVREYGSYPFTSFSYVFVSDAQLDVSHAAGMAMCSEKLLFPPEVIEPMFNHVETLTVALTSQWCGVNIVPRTWNDLWITVGVSRYMAQCFVRRLLGNNEYRFRIKSQAERITEVDINRPPLAAPVFNFPIGEDDLWFLKLKAPVILFILDRRMTKIDRSFGLSRVLPKIFLQAMSGDLNNSCLSTPQFMRMCERVSRNNLSEFFEQWVYGSGYPIFRVTQRFNKKRMFVEMGIRQVQMAEVGNPPMEEHTFVQESKAALDARTEGKSPGNLYPVQPIFKGPMTIRIHEADGTPYEHVVDLKENFTKLDIQYNTKYKRLKRNKKNAAAVAASHTNGNVPATNASTPGDVDYNNEDEDGQLDNGVLLHSLGDVLQSDEVTDWKLTDWTAEEEDRMVNEAFEWIRVDADFEWICKLYINQPDYMFCSQLQQDRDVVAQFDAVRHFGMLKPSPTYSSILVRTLMDRRYYYGVRVEAAMQLANCAVADVDFIGKFHLMKAFQSMFCFENSTIPTGNEFSDFTNYFVQKAIPWALSTIRDNAGNCPLDVKNFLLDLLRYNDNANNPFSDCFYVSRLIASIVNSLKRSDRVRMLSIDSNVKQFVNKAMAEIDRCCRMDAWLPSVQNMVTITAIRQKESLVREGLVQPHLDELIQYTKAGNNSDVRLAAFRCLLSFGGLQNKALLKYTFATSAHDFSNYVRFMLVEILQDVIGLIALKGDFKKPSGDTDGMSTVLEGESSAGNARQEALQRTNVEGCTDLVRKSVGSLPSLRRELWQSINDKLHYGQVQKRILLDICQVLYPAIDSYMVTLPTPRLRKLVMNQERLGMMVIKRESRLKIVNNANGKKSDGGGGGPKISIKNKNSGKKNASNGQPQAKELPKVKLKVKLNG